MHTYQLNDHSRFSILVVGAGGTGSAIFLALPYLHQAMQAWGHFGLEVTLMDPDTVSSTNCVRQPFARTDIGRNKAVTLCSRVNAFWGTNWAAIKAPFTVQSLRENSQRGYQDYDLIIGCVDSKASRVAIHKAVTAKYARTSYWLDLGNAASHGQFVLGQPLNARNTKADPKRLRTAAELYPEIIDTTTPEDTLPSCSAREALDRQMPFINQNLAMQALAMLTELLRFGKIDYHGAFYNAKTGKSNPIPVPNVPPPPRRKK